MKVLSRSFWLSVRKSPHWPPSDLVPIKIRQSIFQLFRLLCVFLSFHWFVHSWPFEVWKIAKSLSFLRSLLNRWFGHGQRLESEVWSLDSGFREFTLWTSIRQFLEEVSFANSEISCWTPIRRELQKLSCSFSRPLAVGTGRFSNSEASLLLITNCCANRYSIGLLYNQILLRCQIKSACYMKTKRTFSWVFTGQVPLGTSRSRQNEVCLGRFSCATKSSGRTSKVTSGTAEVSPPMCRCDDDQGMRFLRRARWFAAQTVGTLSNGKLLQRDGLQLKNFKFNSNRTVWALRFRRSF